IAVFSILTTAAMPAFAGDSSDTGNLNQMHQKIGKMLDTAYFNAGTNLDLIRFDIAGLQRQGVQVPKQIINKLSALDKQMRQRWLALDQTRSKIHKQIIKVPPKAPNYIKISVSESNTNCWLGLHSAKLTSSNGKTIALPASGFKYGTRRSVDGKHG